MTILAQALTYQQHLDEAGFALSLAINRAAYPGGRHFKVDVALSNLGGALLARGRYQSAEAPLREAIAVLTAAQSSGHVNTAVARVKLGRVLLREGRLCDAERELGAGYDVLAKHAGASPTWLRASREDLAAVFDALQQPERARIYLDELSARAN